MKKLFFIISFLILVVVSFGATPTEGVIQEKVEKTLNGEVSVKAKVIGSLGLSSKALDFGNVFPVSQSKAEETPGEVEVIGKPTPLFSPLLTIVRLEIKDDAGKFVAYQGQNQIFNVTLKNNNEKTMKAEVKLSSRALAMGSLNGKIALGTDGIVNFKVTGKLSVSNNQDPGYYEGKLYLRVMPD